MAWERVQVVEDTVAIWRDRYELFGKKYAVTAKSTLGWHVPIKGQYRTLREARAAARERLREQKEYERECEEFLKSLELERSES